MSDGLSLNFKKIFHSKQKYKQHINVDKIASAGRRSITLTPERTAS